MTSAPLFENVTLIGIGLIGSSLSHAMRKHGLAGAITVATRRQETLDCAIELGLCTKGTLDFSAAVKDCLLYTSPSPRDRG